MGVFDFLKRNKKKAVSADTVLYEALKKFGDQKTTDRPPAKTPEKPAVKTEEKPPEKPVYNEEQRKQEVQAIRDDRQLIEIINAGKDHDAVLRIAIANLSDQSLLVRVVERTRILNKYSDQCLRKLIIDNVTDQRTLYKMAVGEKYTKTKDDILSRIND